MFGWYYMIVVLYLFILVVNEFINYCKVLWYIIDKMIVK